MDFWSIAKILNFENMVTKIKYWLISKVHHSTFKEKMKEKSENYEPASIAWQNDILELLYVRKWPSYPYQCLVCHFDCLAPFSNTAFNIYGFKHTSICMPETPKLCFITKLGLTKNPQSSKFQTGSTWWSFFEFLVVYWAADWSEMADILAWLILRHCYPYV